LVKQAKLIGMLYLENNLASHVFTPARILLLNLLSSQAAISLENARLYAELIEENRDRERAEEALRGQAKVGGAACSKTRLSASLSSVRTGTSSRQNRPIRKWSATPRRKLRSLSPVDITP